MKRLPLCFEAIAACCLLASGAQALPSYSGAYSFGDSLVDSGNAQDLAAFAESLPPPFPDVPDPTPASLGYFEGRFTNGYHFADLLSLAVTGSAPSTTFPHGFPLPGGIEVPIFAPTGNSVNFAYGGSQILRGTELVPDASEQVAALAGLPGPVDPGALYVLAFGGNDIRELVPASSIPATEAEAAAYISAAALELQAQIARLDQLGARNILVAGVPDVGLVPRYDKPETPEGQADEASRRALATALSLQLDLAVQAVVAELAGEAGRELFYFSLFDFSRDLVSNPEAFGLTNLSQPCLAVQLPSPSIDCSGFLFFDLIHPTAHVHALAADAMLDLLSRDGPGVVPEPAAIGLLGLALAALAARRRRCDLPASPASSGSAA